MDAHNLTGHTPHAATSQTPQPLQLESASMLRMLQETIESLVHSVSMDADPLMSLFEHIVAETANLPLAAVLNFVASPAMVEERPGGLTRNIADRGLRSACLLTALMPLAGLPRSTHETLALAAMLHDAGYVVLGIHHRPAADFPSANVIEDRRHPSIGAALAGGILRCASDLPMLIAEHHEYLNGTGYPHGRRARQLTSSSRILQIVCGFAEAVRTKRASCADVAGVSAADIVDFAVSAIDRSATLGRFDPGLSREALDPIRNAIPELRSLEPSPPVVSPSELCQPAASSAEPNTAPSAVPAPKFMKRRTGVGYGASVRTADEVAPR